MLKDEIKSIKQVHSRVLTLSTFPFEKGRIIVKGELKDLRHVPVFDLAGNVKQPGTVHHMKVFMLIDPSPLKIIRAEAEMPTIPSPLCPGTLDRVDLLQGIEIKSGFSRKVRQIMGGNLGCTHLCSLIVAMGQEIVQGWFTRKNSEKPPKKITPAHLQQGSYLIDSCRVWKKDGPKHQELIQTVKALSSPDF